MARGHLGKLSSLLNLLRCNRSVGLAHLKQTDFQRMADSIPFSVRAFFGRLGNDLLLAAFIAHSSDGPVWGYPIAFGVDVIFSGHGLTL